MTSTEAHHSAIGEEASSRRARAAGAGVNFLLKEKDHTLQKKVVQSAEFSSNTEAPFRLRIYDVERRPLSGVATRATSEGINN